MADEYPSPQFSERRYQRSTCLFPASFHWGTITNQGTVMVISLGGCFLATPAAVPEGEKLDLSFWIEPNRDPVRCQARVAWVAKKGVKIRGNKTQTGFATEFKQIFPEDRQRIDYYVKRQTRVFKAIDHELGKARPDRALIKDLFSQVRPGESTHLNHIKKACRDERRFRRLRK